MMKMMMICNPYQKTIQYLWYDEAAQSYVDMCEMTNLCPELSNPKFIRDVTIQTRADEIVRIIDALDPSDDGVDVHFIGTQDDFDDLKRVVEQFYASKNIHCIKEASYYWDAETALSSIEERFLKVEDIFNSYQESEIVDLLNTFKDTMKPELAICIMGLYSSGKSAFINSLVGCELLPSASDPTTAKVCRIQCRDSFTIKLSVDNLLYTVNFDQDEPEVIGASESNQDIINLIKQNSKLEKQEDEKRLIGNLQQNGIKIGCMYSLLKFLNSNQPFGSEHIDGEMIEVTVPYVNTLLPIDKFDFVIYDTPGSNSASNKEHFRVLNEALSAQTNALPIILTIPDTMDSTDNDQLLELIHGNENKLDTTNGLIVVNKSDDKGPRSLAQKREKIDGLKLTKWKSTRIFFVSSILGLASKKSDPHDENCWFDLDAFEIYDKNSGYYESGQRKLYEYNIIDKSRVFEYDLSEKDGVNALLNYNSGLASVEFEIANYAKRYALYHKCREAIKYLKKAISICETYILQSKDRLHLALSNELGLFEARKQLVEEALSKQRTAVVKSARETCLTELNNAVEGFKQRHKITTTGVGKKYSYIYEFFPKKWSEIKGAALQKGANEQEALRVMQKLVSDEFNLLLKEASDELNLDLEKHWKTRTDVFLKIIRGLILKSQELTSEQKDILDAYILEVRSFTDEHFDFDLREQKGTKKGYIRLIPLGKENFDNSRCCSSFLNEFDSQIHERVKNAVERNEARFDVWCGEIIRAIMDKISTFNEEFKEAEQVISKLQEDIEIKNKNCQLLRFTEEFVSNLLNMQIIPSEDEKVEAILHSVQAIHMNGDVF